MKREEVTELVERGIGELSDALAAGKSDRLQEYLAMMARFPKYSFNNTLLILLQNPDARMVQGFHAWKKLGRTVIKGQKGIGIIAPMIGKKRESESPQGKDTRTSGDGEKKIFGFKVVHVFDVAQTEGDDLPDVAGVTGDPGPHSEAIEKLIRSLEIELLYEAIEGGADGLSKKGTIVISPDLEPARRLLTLIHEVAHETMHGDPERRKQTTKTIRETEAEAVAFVVASSLGIECIGHSSDYIQLYNGDAEVLAKSLDAIQKASAQILEGIQENASTRETEEVA